MNNSHTIQNAYISVEIAHQGLDHLKASLNSFLQQSGVECEVASSASHVSIAYGEGEVSVEALDRVASEIASLPFSVRVSGFEIFKGEATPFDYLVVNLEKDQSVGVAFEKAQGCMKTKTFSGEFRSHVSLLKFAKGSLSSDRLNTIVSEMNACQQAAQALGRPRVCLRGSHVSVFGSDRQCHLSKCFSSVAA